MERFNPRMTVGLFVASVGCAALAVLPFHHSEQSYSAAATAPTVAIEHADNTQGTIDRWTAIGLGAASVGFLVGTLREGLLGEDSRTYY
jgi:hypothetical protein